jgi:hypothetical protein
MKSDGSGMCLGPRDFLVGTNLVIHGKNMRITDADVYTREFFQHNGIT